MTAIITLLKFGRIDDVVSEYLCHTFIISESFVFKQNHTVKLY